MKKISFNDVYKKIEEAPDGYVPRECYEAALERAQKLDDICRYLRDENRELKTLVVQVADAIRAFNKVIGEKGFIKDDKD